MNTTFDIAKSLKLNLNSPTFKEDELKLNLQLSLYIIMRMVESYPDLAEKIAGFQNDFVKEVENGRSK